MGSLQNPQEERAGVSTRAAERKRRRREDETSPERERRQIGSRERMRTFRARIRGEPEAAEMAVREAGRLRRRRAEERDAERTGRRRVQWEHGRSIGQNVASMSRPETVQENYLGLMNKECEFCHALFFESEVGRDPHRINVCCNYGTVQLSDTFGDYPEILQQLFTTDSERAKNFRDNIRRFNSALAMASMGAQLDIPVGRGPYCFRVHGQVYHLAGPLHPAPGQRPAYGQIYILDSEQAAEERLNNLSNANCDRQVMTELGSLFACINPFAGAYKMMAEVERDEEEKAALEGRPVTRIKMIFDTSLNTDQRRYNIPTSNEVAVIYVGEDDDIPATRSLAVHPRSGGLRNIRDIDGICDPLTYPLFFPKGQKGWDPSLTRVNSNRRRTRVTQKEYYSFLLQVRNSFCPLKYGRALFQQYIVDSWVKIEQNRLNYHRMHQQDIRSEQYQTLHDFVLSNNTASGPPGKRIILPSSYPGSPRAVMQDFQDAMAIVSAHGKPDYFVTFTCNPKWREIEENLLPGQSASDRPDLVARIYKLKVDALLHALLHEHVWGRVRAYVSVYEWQKRGLPHTHTLLIMDEDAKPRNPNDVDSIVRAELPDRQAEPLLYDIVSKNMIHRPCGDLNPLAPCMLNGACLKRFPKRFRDFTNVEIDGYPEYRRRDDGNTVEYQGVRLDNRWIVPYNPRLTMMLRAHVNVEMCAMIEAVKYLFKYVYKGPDRGAVRLIRREHLSEDGHITDEISAHLDVRYVCAPEAVHHIFGFRTGRKSDVICRLAVHLSGQQNITFQAGHEPQAALRALTRNSTLTAWFKKNEESAAIANSGSLADDFLDSRLYRYVEMPCYYTFNRATTLWNRRQRGSRQIGRMYTVSPQDPERYALRLLLLNVKGAVSFEHLRTVESGDGSVVVCQTFAEAARTNGLLADDSHYLLTLQEAAAFQMPRQLRAVFVAIIAFNEVNDCNVLWERTKRDLSEDFRNQGRNEDEAEAMAYYEIEERLGRLGKDLKQFLRVPAPPPPPPSAAEATDFRPRECRLKGQQLYATLNTEQKAACDTIIRSIDTASSERLFFIDGPGGSGKTYLYQTMFNLLVGRNLRVLCTAWTGIAANLLPAGRTSASAFKLNVKNNCEDSHIKRLTRASRELEALHVIIWDEASMIPKAALQTVNSLLRDVTQSSALFGGKTVILGGDFRQVLPIVRRGSREAQVDACIKRSDLWNYFTSLHLFSNMRIATGDADWIEFLRRAGDGTANDEDGRISLPEGIVSHDNLVVKIFGNSIDPLDQSDMSERAILAPKNVDADFLNHEVLNRLQGEEKAYHSVDEAICDDPSHVATYPTDFLHRINLSRLPTHVLRLKKGCVVILLRNLDITEGLCNGTRLVVERFGPRLLACRFACGERKGLCAIIPRIDNYADNNLPFRLLRRQFPVRLAFALSINKAQGQSFSRIGLWLPSEVFTHGQLYVALSRVKSREGFLLQADCDNRPLNVVYREVL